MFFMNTDGVYYVFHEQRRSLLCFSWTQTQFIMFFMNTDGVYYVFHEHRRSLLCFSWTKT